MRKFLKTNWLKICAIELLVFVCAFLSVFPLYFKRNGNNIGFSLCIVGYAITLFLSLLLIWLFFKKINKNNDIDLKKKKIFAMVFYILTLLLASILITVTFLIIKAVTPDSIILVQGLLSFVLAIVCFIVLLVPIQININFLN